MIRQVSLRRFKRFAAVDLKLSGHVVLAGPNNGGKTTLLQAIASWDLAFRRWRELNDPHKHGGAYSYCPIARPDFLAVPLPRNGLDLLWTGRDRKRAIEIGVRTDGWYVTMEFTFDEEQVKVRPVAATPSDVFGRVDMAVVYVPPMGGLVPEEPQYADQAFLIGRFAEGRPGEVIRNLLLEASRDAAVWAKLVDAVRELFGCELEPPQRGRYLQANYRIGDGKPLDLIVAGSGFQQVLLLMSMLVLRPGSVLLLDEPDAHLHVILQGSTYRRLQKLAAESGAQLIVSTHSEVIIDAADLTQIVAMPAGRALASPAERGHLIRGLGLFSNTDVMLAQTVPGILYVEGHTDIQLLAAWARVLRHPALDVLTRQLFWHRYSTMGQENIASFSAKEHYEALRVHRYELAALEILDRDGHPKLPSTAVAGAGFQRLRWKRYEIENYLVHPAALARFVEQRVGAGDASAQHRAALHTHFVDTYAPTVAKNPLDDNPALVNTKASTELLGAALTAAGVHGVEKRDFHEIAALMLPSEVHPDVIEKLDAICTAFGIPLTSPPPPASGAAS
ncbi:MAG: AAA family ATPase [Planctomycetota bacterium]